MTNIPLLYFHFRTLLIFPLIILLAVFISPVFADSSEDTILKPFVATYMFSALGMEGINVTNSLSLSKKGEYHFKSYSMPVGILAFSNDETRDEQSKGQIVNQQVRPYRYSYVLKSDNEVIRDVEIHFDWHLNEVTNYHNNLKNHWTMSITSQTMDKFSYQLGLMIYLSGKPDNSFSFKVADGGRLKDYNFKILGEERVYTSLGSYKTIKLEHQTYQKNKTITIWCAPALNYLPVKIEQYEKRRPTYTSTLISYQEGILGE